MNKRLYTAIGLLSASMIAFQLALMQILSISQWNHFAYMVISVALLGFGASGTALTFLKNWLTRHIELSLPALLLLTATSMGLIMHFSGQVFGGFDSYLLFLDKSHIYGLILSYFALFVPFFLGAMAIGLAYLNYVSRIGTLYFADLFGSGLGGLLMLFLFWHFAPASLPFVIALLPLLGGILLLKKHNFLRSLYFLIPAMLVQFYGFKSTPVLPMSQYKSLSRAMLLPGAVVVDEKTSPFGEMKLIKAEALRFAPGLSLTYTKPLPVQQALYNNGNWYGPLVDFGVGDSSHFLDYATNALPFVISKPEKVMIPDAGTGLYAAHALARGAASITAVEPNKLAIDLLKKHMPFPNDHIHIVNMHPRSYLMADTSKYDLIILPVIESFGGSSGINALQEQYLFTLEAFAEMWDRLSADGMIAVTVWMDYPARNSLKMLATLVETAAQKAPGNAENHIMAIRGWGTLTMVLKKSAVEAAEIERVRAFCKLRNFDPLIFPGIEDGERTYFNQLQDDSFLILVDQLMSGNRMDLYNDYNFQIRPATDSRPYFSQFLKINRLPEMKEIFGQSAVPFLEVGYLIVLLTLVQITLAALLLIIIPLFFIGFKGGGKAYALLHFSGIGIGFMFVEIILIQQFTLYFGHPIYAAAAVLSGMLIFSGSGAFFSGTLIRGKQHFIVYIASIVLVLLFLTLALTPMLRASISQPMAIKVLVSIVTIGPLAFLMGIPFPVGLGLLSKQNKNLIPWAWAINGCFSVISTALATLVAVEAGYYLVMLIAALAYLVSLTINLRMPWKTA